MKSTEVNGPSKRESRGLGLHSDTRNKSKRYINTIINIIKGLIFLNKRKGVSGNNQDIDGILKQNNSSETFLMR